MYRQLTYFPDFVLWRVCVECVRFVLCEKHSCKFLLRTPSRVHKYFPVFPHHAFAATHRVVKLIACALCFYKLCSLMGPQSMDTYVVAPASIFSSHLLYNCVYNNEYYKKSFGNKVVIQFLLFIRLVSVSSLLCELLLFIKHSFYCTETLCAFHAQSTEHTHSERGSTNCSLFHRTSISPIQIDNRFGTAAWTECNFVLTVFFAFSIVRRCGCCCVDGIEHKVCLAISAQKKRKKKKPSNQGLGIIAEKQITCA